MYYYGKWILLEGKQNHCDIASWNKQTTECRTSRPMDDWWRKKRGGVSKAPLLIVIEGHASSERITVTFVSAVTRRHLGWETKDPLSGCLGDEMISMYFCVYWNTADPADKRSHSALGVRTHASQDKPCVFLVFHFLYLPLFFHINNPFASVIEACPQIS